jgi:hypothetical protein
VTEAAEAGERLEVAAERGFRAHGIAFDAAWADPAAVAAAAAYGGGPAEPSLRRALGELRAGWGRAARRLRDRARRWRRGARELDAAVAAVRGGAEATEPAEDGPGDWQGRGGVLPRGGVYVAGRGEATSSTGER